MTRYELAVDPGATGGAWLGYIDPEGVNTVAAIWWKPCKRQNKPAYKVIAAGRIMNEERIIENLFEIGCWIREIGFLSESRAGWRLTVEGLFGHGHTLERLSWYGGLLCGPLLSRAVGAVERPLAVQWRRDLLGIGPRTPADVCDQRVAAWADKMVPSIPLNVRNSHVCDAAALAVWRAQNDDG